MPPNRRWPRSVIKKKLMTPATLKTILNTAPIIMQGASKLIQLMRERNAEAETPPQPDLPMTVEGLKQGMERMEQRLNDNNESNLEQMKLIEELARQNKAMAESLERSYRRINFITIISVVALLLSVVGILFAFIAGP